MIPGSSCPPHHLLDLFSVATRSTPQLRCVHSQLVCLLPVKIFKHFMFISVTVKYCHWMTIELVLYIKCVIIITQFHLNNTVNFYCIVKVFDENEGKPLFLTRSSSVELFNKTSLGNSVSKILLNTNKIILKN